VRWRLSKPNKAERERERGGEREESTIEQMNQMKVFGREDKESAVTLK
jgi:hypothetical protein